MCPCKHFGTVCCEMNLIACHRQNAGALQLLVQAVFVSEPLDVHARSAEPNEELSVNPPVRCSKISLRLEQRALVMLPSKHCSTMNQKARSGKKLL